MRAVDSLSLTDYWLASFHTVAVVVTGCYKPRWACLITRQHRWLTFINDVPFIYANVYFVRCCNDLWKSPGCYTLTHKLRMRALASHCETNIGFHCAASGQIVWLRQAMRAPLACVGLCGYSTGTLTVWIVRQHYVVSLCLQPESSLSSILHRCGSERAKITLTNLGCQHLLTGYEPTAKCILTSRNTVNAHNITGVMLMMAASKLYPSGYNCD